MTRQVALQCKRVVAGIISQGGDKLRSGAGSSGGSRRADKRQRGRARARGSEDTPELAVMKQVIIKLGQWGRAALRSTPECHDMLQALLGQALEAGSPDLLEAFAHRLQLPVRSDAVAAGLIAAVVPPRQAC